MNASHPETKAAGPTWAQRRAEREATSGPIVMYQTWEQLLFLHWRWDAAVVQRTLPSGLTVDVADGSAWLGLVPLFMRKVRPRFIPALPGASDFLELNLRTYVFDADGRPGLYFYSLDCNQPLLVEGARRLLHLRYEHSDMDATVSPGGGVRFQSRRRAPDAGTDRFQYHIAPHGGHPAEPESLEYFLIERYRLFGDGGPGDRLTTIHVSHAPYEIHPAIVSAWSGQALRQAGFEVGARAPDHICGAAPVHVEVSMPGFVERG
jgi:uncharacterized protein YqjF (DUF2071 family)